MMIEYDTSFIISIVFLVNIHSIIQLINFIDFLIDLSFD